MTIEGELFDFEEKILGLTEEEKKIARSLYTEIKDKHTADLSEEGAEEIAGKVNELLGMLNTPKEIA